MDVTVFDAMPLFEGLTASEKQDLMSRMEQVNLRRGQILFNEGDEGDRLFIVVQGKLKLGHRSGDGRENLLAVVGPGEMIGELTLFDPGPRSSTATAVAPTSLLWMSHDTAHAFLESHPALLTKLLRLMAMRLRKTNANLADLVFSDVPGRVAKALLDLSERFGTQVSDGLHVPHDLTQEELAQLVGASRETVNKALAEFVNRNWIRLEGRAVTLLDPERLDKRSR